MSNDDFNDDLSDMLGGKGPVATPKQPPASYIPLEKRFEEACPKCRGTGKFVSYSGRVIGDCFNCKGAGKKVFKTSPESRAAARVSSAARSQQKAQSLLGEITQWQEQHAAIERNLANIAERKAAREAAAPVVETSGIDRLKAAFDKAAAFTAAKATGLTVRNPKITMGGVTISPAKATSANPGALYVKSGETYLGKIADGKFFATGDCTPEQQAQVLKFVADPAEAAKVYGQETGVCCVCNATLRSEWRLRGIGPICAEKFGW